MKSARGTYLMAYTAYENSFIHLFELLRIARRWTPQYSSYRDCRNVRLDIQDGEWPPPPQETKTMVADKSDSAGDSILLFWIARCSIKDCLVSLLMKALHQWARLKTIKSSFQSNPGPTVLGGFRTTRLSDSSHDNVLPCQRWRCANFLIRKLCKMTFSWHLGKSWGRWVSNKSQTQE